MVVLCLSVQFNKVEFLCASECTVQQGGIFVLSLCVLYICTTRWDDCAVSAFTVQQGGMVVLCLSSQYNTVGWLAVSAFTVQGRMVVLLTVQCLSVKWYGGVCLSVQ
jgi:hypothetical protein